MIRAQLCLLLAALVILSPGCADVRFRLAMARVQERYVELLDRVNAELVEQVPAAAEELGNALTDPRIVTHPRYTSDEKFRAIHETSLNAIKSFGKEAETADAQQLLVSKVQISQACSSCHNEYKPLMR